MVLIPCYIESDMLYQEIKFTYNNIDIDGVKLSEDKKEILFKIRGHASGVVFESFGIENNLKNKSFFEKKFRIILI